MSPVKLTVAELAQRSPGEPGVSDWFSILQDRVNLFADATDDHQWIHVDAERARTGPFGTTIAHGYLTLSLLPRMLDDILQVTDQVRGTNYGLDRIRFTSPVAVGSEIRTVAELTAAERRTDGGVQYRVRVTVQIRDQDRPAMVGEGIFLAYSS